VCGVVLASSVARAENYLADVGGRFVCQLADVQLAFGLLLSPCLTIHVAALLAGPVEPRELS
jgi:hypothetical protein